jgi:TPR repeat protein
MYHSGEGVTQDANKAVNWYREPADQLYVTAQSNLGLMHEGPRTAKEWPKA